MQILHAVNAKHLNTSLRNGTEDKHYCIKHDIDFFMPSKFAWSTL